MHQAISKLTIVASLAGIMLLVGSATAAPVELATNSDTGTIQLGTNAGDFAGTGHDGPKDGAWGHLGAEVRLPNEGSYRVDYEFVSAEAGWENDLRLDLPPGFPNPLILRGGGDGGTVQTSPIGTSGQTSFNTDVDSSGLSLPFLFEVFKGAGSGKRVVNSIDSANPDANLTSRKTNFFVGFKGATESDNPTEGSEFTLAFDDGGGSGDDDDHDDLVVDVTVSEVPAPGILGLMTIGLMGLFGAGRRRMR